jgi:hypothetical protein
MPLARTIKADGRSARQLSTVGAALWTAQHELLMEAR